VNFLTGILIAIVIFIVWGIGKFVFRMVWGYYSFMKNESKTPFIDTKTGKPFTEKKFQEKMREGVELGLMPGDESENLESDDIDIEISTNYYDNGQKKSKGSLKDGKKDGIWIEWDEDGHTFEEYNYKDGILNGLYAAFYESGKRIQAGTYKDGERDGLWTYYRLGLIFEEVIYENGEVIDVLKWENRWENMWRVVGGKINSNVVGDEN